MTVIATIDGPNRRIYLHSDTQNSELNPIDIYKEMRVLRRTNEALRKFDLFLNASGYEPKGAGKFTARLTRELLGTRIVPFDSDHELTITGEIISDDGFSGVACFDRSGLVGRVDINYVPPQVEIIEKGGGLTDTQDATLALVDVAVSSRSTPAEAAGAVWGMELPP